ncbi:hypothetical protein Bbelb_218530 [Branchiostoma belcheri]|nr:hypothetical protein Bbelb_218530 [Branchiostoma belcheri]
MTTEGQSRENAFNPTAGIMSPKKVIPYRVLERENSLPNREISPSSMPSDSITRTALRWTPQGRRLRGRPKETSWRRTIDKEVRSHGFTLDEAPFGQEPTEITIRRRKWRWIGHTLQKPPTSITRTALDWNPQGQRHRGRPRLSWRRGVRKDLERANVTWQETKKIAMNRKRWRLLTEALYS